jgi:hypothetical protein
VPRKLVVHWMAVPPQDLSRCHAKRCTDTAAQDRLCPQHWTAWKLEGFKPAMPNYAADAEPTESPLKRELKALWDEMDQLSNEVAALRVDDVQGLADLEVAKKHVEQRIEEIKKRHHESVAPFIEAERRTSSWFERVGAKAKTTLSYIEHRTETARASIAPPAAPRRRVVTTVVNPPRRRVGPS